MEFFGAFLSTFILHNPRVLNVLLKLLSQFVIEMTREASKIEDALSSLKNEYKPGPQQHRETAIKTVSLRLSTFAQALESLLHVFEAELNPWVGKKNPIDSGLGGVATEALESLQSLQDYFSDIKEMRQILVEGSDLSNEFKEKVTRKIFLNSVKELEYFLDAITH